MSPFSDFTSPAPTYRPMPFWFWNGKLEIPELERQIADMHNKGIGGFFIHARFGLDTEYLSPHWLDCVRASIDVASKFGMEVWLYDENNFPSGIGDVKVSSQPEFSPKFVDLTETLVEGPSTVTLDLPAGSIVGARAVSCAGGQPLGQSVDLSAMIHGRQLRWDAPSGDWQVMVFVSHVLSAPNGNVFGVDYLSRRAAEQFIETTHDIYAREIGEHFGKTVKGFFVDEPTLLPWHHDISWYGNRKDARVVVWSPILEERLERLGLPASELLPHLFYTIDGTSADKRRTFYHTVSDLYVESFFAPYRAWCDAHGLLLTGHLLLEEGLYCNTIFQSDPARALAHMHIPGTDHLGMGAEAPYGGWAHLPRTMTNIQGEKLVSSVAHHQGCERVLSETFGCAGWGLTLQDMKRITDWQYSIGVNFMCPHAFFYTIEGFRKADAPPSHNHNAFWPYYRHYGDYVGRLSYMLSGGVHVADVAVLYPLDAFQRVYEIGRECEADRAVCDAFDAVCTVLPQIHHDYDILHPDTLLNSNVDGGELVVAGERFRALILPANIEDAEVLARVDEFRRGGGLVIGPGGGIAGDLDALGVHLRHELAGLEDVKITTGDNALSPIRCLHRRNDGQDVYFLANMSGEMLSASISFAGEMGLDEYDLETGAVSSAMVEVADGRTSLGRSFEAWGSAMLVSSDERLSATHVPTPECRVIELGDEWEFTREHPNGLALGKWDFELDTRGNTNRFSYRTRFEAEDVPSGVKLLLDDISYRHALMGGMNLNVTVNGREWRNPETEWYLDTGFRTLDISSAVKKGENEVQLCIHHDAWAGEPKLLTSVPKLIGDFEVADPYQVRIRPCSKTLRTGSWSDQGYPFYSGTGCYTGSFTLPEEIGGASISLVVDDVRDMFEAEVNGVSAGTRPWRPWKLDITDFVRPGNNSLVLKVANTMHNFLEGETRSSGLTGRVRVEIAGLG